MTEMESAEKTRLYVSFQLNAGSAVVVFLFYGLKRDVTLWKCVQ